MRDDVAALLKEIKDRPAAVTVEQRRAAFKFLCSFSGDALDSQFHSVRIPTRDRDSIEARIYGQGPTVLVWFHGGGYVCGDVDTHHAAMTQLSAGSPHVTLVSVGYRLAPEYKFPTALHDAQDAVMYVRATLDPERLILGGDSAGGNLAASLGLSGVRSDAQILCYPTLDALFRAKSWDEIAVKDIANKKDSRDFDLLYARSEADFTDPLFSPVFAPVEDALSRQPPTTILLGECDPARGDGEMYATQLAKAGVRVKVRIFDGMVHGFLTMASRLEGTRELHSEIEREILRVASAE